MRTFGRNFELKIPYMRGQPIGTPPVERHNGSWVLFLYPSLVGTFPLDTTKTRLQVQGQRMDELCRSSRYRGMMHALLRISQEEGVRALYKG